LPHRGLADVGQTSGRRGLPLDRRSSGEAERIRVEILAGGGREEAVGSSTRLFIQPDRGSEKVRFTEDDAVFIRVHPRDAAQVTTTQLLLLLLLLRLGLRTRSDSTFSAACRHLARYRGRDGNEAAEMVISRSHELQRDEKCHFSRCLDRETRRAYCGEMHARPLRGLTPICEGSRQKRRSLWHDYSSARARYPARRDRPVR